MSILSGFLSTVLGLGFFFLLEQKMQIHCQKKKKKKKSRIYSSLSLSVSSINLQQGFELAGFREHILIVNSFQNNCRLVWCVHNFKDWTVQIVLHTKKTINQFWKKNIRSKAQEFSIIETKIWVEVHFSNVQHKEIAMINVILSWSINVWW